MKTTTWLHLFFESLRHSREKKSGLDGDFTEFIGLVMDKMAKNLNCKVVRRRAEGGENSGEYLCIDFFFLDENDYSGISYKEWDSYVLPKAVVEHENPYEVKKVCYCLWKVLCIRVPLKVLICYQKSNPIPELVKKLEEVIWNGELMKGSNSNLLVLIGDENSSDDTEWSDYYSVFEWRNDRLEKIDSPQCSTRKDKK